MSEKAKRIRKIVRYVGGVETKLDHAAILSVVLGVILAIWRLVESSGHGILVCLFLIAIGLAMSLLFRTFAEMIRLQKKSAGLPFAGKISEADPIKVEFCGECGEPLYNYKRCDSCGRELESETASEQKPEGKV